MLPTRSCMALLCLAVALVPPQPATAQDDRGPLVLELRGGAAHHAGNGCGSTGSSTDPALGVDLRTRGRWITSVSLDVFWSEANCVGVGLQTQYQGQTVDVTGQPSVGPRLAMSVGYGFSVADVRVELTAGLGAIVEGDLDARSDETTLRAWQGGALTVRFPFGMALQYEDGRHRVLTERYYLAGTDELVRERERWARMWRVAVTVPVAG